MCRSESKVACHVMAFPWASAWPGGARMLITPFILDQHVTVAGLGVTLQSAV